MTLELIISGLSLGLLSSFHCVGMCGPIGFALPVQQLNGGARSVAILGYHLGRITTYAILGLIFGLLGRQVYLAGFQQSLSISLGVIILVFVLLNYFGKSPGASYTRRFQVLLVNQMSGLLKKGKSYTFPLLGMANGLLPCGMVYLAIAGAMTNHDLRDAVSFMAVFGAGTLPTLLALQYFRYKASLTWRNLFRQLTPYIIAITGILLI